MKTSYIFSSKLFYTFLFALLSPGLLLAEGDTDYIKIKNAYHTTHNQIVTLNDLSVAEEGGFFVNKNSRKIRYAKVELIYGREDKTDLQGDDWEYEVTVAIKDVNGNTIGNPTLRLETGSQAKYRSSFRLPILFLPSVSYHIENISAANGTLSGSNEALFELSGGVELIKQILPEDIRLEFSIETEKHYYLNADESPNLTLNSDNFSYDKTNPLSKHSVELFWNFIWGAEEYELQVGFVDFHTVNAPTGTEVFENSISINVTNTWYHPEVIYPKGTVYFRVRPIGRYIYGVPLGDFDKIKPGAWSAVQTLTITENFESDYNWQLSQTFAEDGKRKSVISYYDQSLRSRQVQTNLNTEEATLVAENKYDFEGRPSLSILPVPAMNATSDGLVNDLFYKGDEGANLFTGLNKNTSGISYEKVDFDKTGFANPLGDGDASGAGTYFSSNNQLDEIHNNLIPNAEGYPITQTRYSRDATGRVITQSGVGTQFQLGGDHATKYIYSSANETELRRLFGSNVGNASHYKKNVVIDANGQVSVSYLDMAGRVIATALADEAPDQLDAIYPTNAGGEIIVNLDDHHQLDLENRVSTLDYTFALPLAKDPGAPATYTFTYDLGGVNQSIPLIDGNTLCEECSYRLSIKVIDPDGLTVSPTGDSTPDIVEEITFDGNESCNDPNYSVTNNVLKVEIWKAGEYRVVKQLELLTPAYDLDFLIEEGIIEDPTVEFQAYLINNPINPLECIVNCEQCELLLTTYDPNDPVVQGWYNECLATKCPCESCEDAIGPNAVADCYNNCATEQAEQEITFKENRCNGLYQNMRIDVSPGGWLFENDSWLTAVVLLEASDSNSPISLYSVAQLQQLRDDWEDSWADEVIEHHREYCHYEFCSNPNDFDYNSDKFNRSLQRASQTWDANITWTEIQNRLNNDAYNPLYSLTNFISVSGGTITAIGWAAADPFFTGDSYETTMAGYINNDYDANPNEGLNPSIGLLQFINTIDPEPDDPNINEWTPLQKWQILVGSYLNAKGNVRDQYIENVLACDFWGDDKAIVTRFNPIPLNYEEMQESLADDQSEHCGDLCEGNVANWLYQLEQDCPDAFTNPSNGQPINVTVWEEVRSLLQSYCMNGCTNNVNPLGIITQVTPGPDPLWDLIVEAEVIIDGLLAGCSASDGLLDGTGNINDEFESEITYTYTLIEDIPGATVDDCEPCEIINNFINFGEWVLADPSTDSYEWQQGHWDLAGLNDYMQAAGIDHYITPFHIIDAIETCNSNGYSFHGALENCTLYEQNIHAYLSNFLGCSGMWSIEGYDPNSGPSICDIPNDGQGQTIVQGALNAIETCAEEQTLYYWNLFQNPSSQQQALDEFNAVYETELSMFYFERILNIYHKICTTQNAEDCDWPPAIGGQNLILNIEDLPCGSYTVVVTEVNTNYDLPAYDEDDFTACIENLTNEVAFEFNEYYSDLVDQLLTELNQQRVDNCFSAANGFNETLSLRYFDLEYQYTLYYYDQAGNLTQTIPPEGVNRVTDFDQNGIWGGTEPAHTRITRYQYNTLNQVVSQSTPETRDGVSTNGSGFVYDYLSRLRFSQDAEQKYITNNNPVEDPAKYSYTRYDDLGRIVEVGQMEGYTWTEAELKTLANDPDFPSADAGIYTLTEVIHTHYDSPGPDIGVAQANLRNRVSYTENEAILTEYSYDAHGNVSLLAHELKDPTIPGHQQRYGVEYGYDLISGNVNEVVFKPGVDGEGGHQHGIFYHRYEYDADNRLTHVYTSKDGVIWDNDARYFYYLHGPLARVELGEDKVQGLDYYYSLQGWIKGVNNPSPEQSDFSSDGIGTGANQLFAKDAMAYRLGYFYNDYRPINNVGLGNNQLYFAPPTGEYLYNGNISAMETYIAYFNVNNSSPSDFKGLQRRDFGYDQLHRIKESTSATGSYALGIYTGEDPEFTATGPVYTENDLYGTNYSYDKNGNLLTLNRNGDNGTLPTDKLSYHYENAESNLLNYVQDDYPGTGIPSQSANNYSYDKIGNLVYDESGAVLDIKWNVQGKVEEVTFDQTATPTPPHLSVRYTYDAQGNRLSKTTIYSNSTSRQYYLRDASGNVMAIYEDDKDLENVGGITQIELPLFGSSRVGLNHVYDRAVTLYNLNDKQPFVVYGDRGDKGYELSNHLGNVLSVVSDKKLGISNSPTGEYVDYYEGAVVSASDYYPFGLQMPNRTFSSPEYRYGFNGKEKDESGEWGDHTNYDYGFRIYNPGVGRFLSVDPLTQNYPWYTPYQFAGNMPIWAIDLDGLEEWKTNNGPVNGPYKDEFEAEDAAKEQANSVATFDNTFPTPPNPTSEEKEYQDAVNSTTEHLGSFARYEQGEIFKAWLQGIKEGGLDYADAYYKAQIVYLPQILWKGGTALVRWIPKASDEILESVKLIQEAMKNPNLKVNIAESADDLRFLDEFGAQATFGPGLGKEGYILVKEGADLPTVLEEVIHFNQFQKLGQKAFLKNRTALEIEAQHELLRIGRKENWPKEQIDEIESALNAWKNLLQKEVKSGKTGG